MFKIFKRRKDKPALTYGVIQYLNEVIERRQRKVAVYLNNKTKSFSKRKWVLFLCGFCLLFSSIAIDIFYNGIKHSTNKVHIQNISVPAFILLRNKATDSLELMEEIYQHRKDSIFKRKSNH